MLNMSKRARKHQLGLSVITQDVQDMLAVNMSYGVSGNAGRAMLQNAQFKLLLQQDPAVLQLLIDTFDLSEESARYLITAPRGSGPPDMRGRTLPHHHRGHPGGGRDYRVDPQACMAQHWQLRDSGGRR